MHQPQVQHNLLWIRWPPPPRPDFLYRMDNFLVIMGIYHVTFGL